MKKKILIILAYIIVIGVLIGIFYLTDFLSELESGAQKSEIQENITNEINSIDEETEVIVSEEAEEIVRDTIQATLEGEDLSTTEVIESTEDEEDTLEEEETETDATVEQENISYDGDSTGSGLSLLGTYTGLTYYSQADSRWASVMYSSVGDTSQTMKSSACRSNICCNSC